MPPAPPEDLQDLSLQDLSLQEPSLQDQFGQIDIYLFDQLLRGNITPRMRILDAGCGYGRNLVYLLRHGADIHALDRSPEAVDHVRQLAASLGRSLPEDRLAVAPIERMPFPEAAFQAVLCNSVLHFAHDESHFRAMLSDLWRVLAPGGILFLRLGSRIGMDFERAGGNLFRIGDGQLWFLVDEEMLLDLTEELDAVQVDPLKTTIVQDYRCMTTWVLRKRHPKPH
jgi:SAM-dependent methyltransferase